ncbi:MAG TPA: hypothetical protein VLI06_20145 [Solimonas sp.]|nr:hypothetical protein [Solimonas sp.]
MRNMLAGLLILTVGSSAFAASVPNTFTAGSPAKASEVNANFAALVSAVNALETKVATLQTKVTALESANGPLTMDDVVGTYRLLALKSETGSSEAVKRFHSASATTDGTVTFNSNGTFTGLTDHRSNGFSGKAQDCASRAADTSNTSVSSFGTHSHEYTEANCNQTAAVFSTQTENSLAQPISGNWALNAGTSTITVSPADGEPLTIYISKRGGVGFAVEAETDADPSNPGRGFSLEVIVRQ